MYFEAVMRYIPIYDFCLFDKVTIYHEAASLFISDSILWKPILCDVNTAPPVLAGLLLAW